MIIFGMYWSNKLECRDYCHLFFGITYVFLFGSSAPPACAFSLIAPPGVLGAMNTLHPHGRREAWG